MKRTAMDERLTNRTDDAVTDLFASSRDIADREQDGIANKSYPGLDLK